MCPRGALFQAVCLSRLHARSEGPRRPPHPAQCRAAPRGLPWASDRALGGPGSTPGRRATSASRQPPSRRAGQGLPVPPCSTEVDRSGRPGPSGIGGRGPVLQSWAGLPAPVACRVMPAPCWAPSSAVGRCSDSATPTRECFSRRPRRLPWSSLPQRCRLSGPRRGLLTSRHPTRLPVCGRGITPSAAPVGRAGLYMSTSEVVASDRSF